MEDGVRHAFRALQVEFRVARDFIADEDDVAQHGKQVLVDALDHLAVDKGDGRRALDVEFDAALALDDGDFKRLVALQQGAAIVDGAAAIQDRQRAAAEGVVQAALAGVEQLVDFSLGEHVQAAFR